jgi:L-aspartate oxidase
MTDIARTDVLIIGGGMAGAWAAIDATRAGAAVTLVEKGYCGTSGITAAAGPGHWWVSPALREEVVAARLKAGQGLGEAAWMHRILDQTWRTLPTLAPEYRFPQDDAGVTNYRAVRGPEYMRALRGRIDSLGVRVLDHHPALELLAWPDGAIAGARGVRRQRGNAAWEIHAGAVVLAAGGSAFLSGLLGARNNTGDGYLMAVEAGAELSGMEFTAAFTIAPAGSNMTVTFPRSCDSNSRKTAILRVPGSCECRQVDATLPPGSCESASWVMRIRGGRHGRRKVEAAGAAAGRSRR